jgi:O-6-methylguanine DNA methyltransferase
MTIDTAHWTSPLGELTIATHAGRLCALTFRDRWPAQQRVLERRLEHVTFRSAAAPRAVTAALRAYFDGDVGAITRLAVDPDGTPFQRRVWSALRALRAGAPVSYGELARRIKRPGAVRAVGTACGANPIWLVIPCHRVIAAGGGLGGYGGGLERKQWLLQHEHRHARLTS